MSRPTGKAFRAPTVRRAISRRSCPTPRTRWRYRWRCPATAGSMGRSPAPAFRWWCWSATRRRPATRAPTMCCRPASTCRACSVAPRRRSSPTRRRVIPCFFSRTAISAARYPTITSTRSRYWRAMAMSWRRRCTATAASRSCSCRTSTSFRTRWRTSRIFWRCRRCVRWRFPRRSTSFSPTRSGRTISMPRASAASARAWAANRCCSWPARG